MLDHYSIDFTDRSGLTLVIRGKRAITESDVAAVQLRMLQHNEIPGFLPVSADERDFVYTFYYSFTGKRIVAQRLKSERLTIQQYFTLLYSIVRALEECKNYMLDENNAILRDDLIFVGKDYADVQLVYLPMKTAISRDSLQGRLKQLAAGLVGSVGQLHGDGIQEVIKALSGDSFHLAEFRLLLRTLVDRASVLPVSPAQTAREKETHRSAAIEEQKPAVLAEHGQTIRMPVLSVDAASIRSWAALFAVIAAAAGVWVWVFLAATEAKVYIGLGVSLLAADAVYLIRKFWPAAAPARAGTQAVFVANQQRKQEQAAPPATVFLGSGQETPVQTAQFELRLEGKSKQYEFNDKRILIGRADTAEIMLDSIGISRAHCEIERVGKTYAAKDLGSVNGSFLNGEKMVPYKSYTLNAGDVIRIVKAELVFKA